MGSLFLINDDLMGFFPEDKDKYNIFEIYKKKNIIIRIFHRLLSVIGFHFIFYRYNWLWVRRLKKVKTVIIFDNSDVNKIINYILSKYPKKKLIVWYWNPVSKCLVTPGKIDSRVEEIWTYDPYDAQKYDLKLNTQFYFKENISKQPKCKKSVDVFFVGADKDRETQLKKLKEIFLKDGITYYFHLTSFWGSTKISDNYKEPLSYKAVVNHILSSKAILDLKNDKFQEGLSLRPLEALFFKRKLITDNCNIVNSKLYNSANVFILGVDDITKIKEFLSKDYYLSNDHQRLIDYYSFDKWRKRFK